MKKLFVFFAALFVIALTNVVNAQMPEGYVTYEGGSTTTTEVSTTTTEDNDEVVSHNTTTTTSHIKNQSRIDKIKSKAWVYRNGGRNNTTSVSSNTNHNSNQGSSHMQTTKVVQQGDGSGGQVAMAILTPILNIGIRVGLSYLPRPNNSFGNGMYNTGYGYNTFGIY